MSEEERARIMMGWLEVGRFETGGMLTGCSERCTVSWHWVSAWSVFKTNRRRDA
jgi:hypothetical protein